jgi:hypothetical protein
MWLCVTVVMSAVALYAQPTRFTLTCAEFPVTVHEADLVARHGRDNVSAAPVFGSDDGPQDGTVLFPKSDDARLEIAWQDEVSKRTPRWIKAVGSRWTTADGISVGTRLQTVERINGRPFRLAGFHTEGGGRVRSWADGRIARRADRENCTITIQFQPQYDGSDDPRLIRQVRFGREYSSAHLALQQLNPKVAVIWLTYLSF